MYRAQLARSLVQPRLAPAPMKWEAVDGQRKLPVFFAGSD
jgi:hypothetical protein